MRRRDALPLIAASAWPAQAQRAQRPRRIAYFSVRPGPNEFEQSFMRGLRELKHTEGADLVVDFHWGNLDLQRHHANITEGLASRPDVVVYSDGAGGLAIVRKLAPGVPVVLPAMRDGIAQGFTTSLARPDGNITGSAVFYAELSGKRLELLKEAVPRLQRAGAVFNAALNANPPQGIAVMTTAGEALGVKVVPMPVTMPGGVYAAYAAAVREGIQGVAVLSDTATISYRATLCEAALAHRLPAMYSNRSYLRGGGLMSYGPDLEAVYHRAAHFVDRLLKGAQVADLPIEQLASFKMTLNLKIARAMSLSFPQALLLRADEVLE